MGMSIEEAKRRLLEVKACLHSLTEENQKDHEAFDMAIAIMRKYQKIEDIYYHQTEKALENSIREVIEDGND